MAETRPPHETTPARRPSTEQPVAARIRRLPGQTFRLSPAVDKLLELINGEIKIFPPLVRLSHGSLDIWIPEGALHFDSVEVFPARDWGSLVVRMETHGIRVEAACHLRESSDVSTAKVVETLRDMQEGESAYEIANAALCLGDARQLVAYLVSAFFPWTLNIRTIE